MKRKVRVTPPSSNPFDSNPMSTWMAQMGGAQAQPTEEEHIYSIAAEMLSQGFSDDDVKEMLISKGFNGAKVNELVNSLYAYIDQEQELTEAKYLEDQLAEEQILAEKEAAERAAQEEAALQNEMYYAEDSDPGYAEEDALMQEILMANGGVVPSKKQFVKKGLDLKKKQMGGPETSQKADDTLSQARPLQKFVSAISNEAEQKALEELYDSYFAQGPESFEEGMPTAQWGGMRGQRRAMRRMNRMMPKLPMGMPYALPSVSFGTMPGLPSLPMAYPGSMPGGVQMANIDVRRTGLFGRPKEYTINFATTSPNQIKPQEIIEQEVRNVGETVEEAKDAEKEKETTTASTENAAVQEELVTADQVQVVGSGAKGSPGVKDKVTTGQTPQAKPTVKRDAWGRPEGDKWFGFDPDKKTWTNNENKSPSQKTVKKDKWGRPEGSKWYGYDPDPKGFFPEQRYSKESLGYDVTPRGFTEKDKWGRSPGDYWYGYDPKTGKWTRGNEKGVTDYVSHMLDEMYITPEEFVASKDKGKKVSSTKPFDQSKYDQMVEQLSSQIPKQSGGEQDSWGRPIDSAWYGFNPETNQFTTKDQWGRPAGSEWYGYDPYGEYWTKGSKASTPTNWAPGSTMTEAEARRYAESVGEKEEGGQTGMGLYHFVYGGNEPFTFADEVPMKDTTDPYFREGGLTKYQTKGETNFTNTGTSIRAERPAPGYTWDEWEALDPTQRDQISKALLAQYQEYQANNTQLPYNNPYIGNYNMYNPYGMIPGFNQTAPLYPPLFGGRNRFNPGRVFTHAGNWAQQQGLPYDPKTGKPVAGITNPQIKSIDVKKTRWLTGAPKKYTITYTGQAPEGTGFGTFNTGFQPRKDWNTPYTPQGAGDKPFGNSFWDMRDQAFQRRNERRAQRKGYNISPETENVNIQAKTYDTTTPTQTESILPAPQFTDQELGFDKLVDVQPEIFAPEFPDQDQIVDVQPETFSPEDRARFSNSIGTLPIRSDFSEEQREILRNFAPMMNAYTNLIDYTQSLGEAGQQERQDFELERLRMQNPEYFEQAPYNTPMDINTLEFPEQPVPASSVKPVKPVKPTAPVANKRNVPTVSNKQNVTPAKSNFNQGVLNRITDINYLLTQYQTPTVKKMLEEERDRLIKNPNQNINIPRVNRKNTNSKTFGQLSKKEQNDYRVRQYENDIKEYKKWYEQNKGEKSYGDIDDFGERQTPEQYEKSIRDQMKKEGLLYALGGYLPKAQTMGQFNMSTPLARKNFAVMPSAEKLMEEQTPMGQFANYQNPLTGASPAIRMGEDGSYVNEGVLTDEDLEKLNQREMSVDYRDRKMTNVDFLQALNKFNTGMNFGVNALNAWNSRGILDRANQNLTGDNIFAINSGASKGTYDPLSGLFRPDEMGFKGVVQKGGSIYKEGGTTYMSAKQIADFIANGGQIEFI